MIATALLTLPLTVCASSSSRLTAPGGFSIQRIATVEGARELAAAPNGDLLVGTNGSGVFIVQHAEGKPAAAHIFAAFPDSDAAGVALNGNNLYVGTQFAIWRVFYRVGDARSRAAPQKLAAVRTSGQARDHVTTTVAVAKGTLYASVGSSCNVCDPDLDETRATIGRVAGGKYTVIAKHIRNAIALTGNENTGALWAGDAGQDELAAGHPYEFFDDVTAHMPPADYGWPYCYDDRRRVPGAPRDCRDAVVPRVIMPAYATPIGAVFYPQRPRGRYAFSPQYAGGAFVTLHGSWHGPPYVAPRVIFVPMRADEPSIAADWNDPGKQWSEFIGGFQNGGSDQRIGRPTGIAVGPQGDLFVADDATGAIYRIRPK